MFSSRVRKLARVNHSGHAACCVGGRGEEVGLVRGVWWGFSGGFGGLWPDYNWEQDERGGGRI